MTETRPVSGLISTTPHLPSCSRTGLSGSPRPAWNIVLLTILVSSDDALGLAFLGDHGRLGYRSVLSASTEPSMRHEVPPFLVLLAVICVPYSSIENKNEIVKFFFAEKEKEFQPLQRLELLFLCPARSGAILEPLSQLTNYPQQTFGDTANTHPRIYKNEDPCTNQPISPKTCKTYNARASC